MYINFKLSLSFALSPFDVVALQAIAQNKYEDNSKVIEQLTDLDKFEKQGMVKFIQGSKKTSKFKLVRLSEKGSRILENIQIPEVNDDDLQVYEWLEKIYKKNEKEIGNVKKTKALIAQFRVHSGIERNHLAFLCNKFIKDDKEMEYSKRLEYLFWKPANSFQVRFDIDQSRLYQYYLKHKDYFDNEFSKITN